MSKSKIKAFSGQMDNDIIVIIEMFRKLIGKGEANEL